MRCCLHLSICRPIRVSLIYAILMQDIFPLRKNVDKKKLSELQKRNLWTYCEERVESFIYEMKRSNDGLHKVARDSFTEVHDLMKVLDESGALDSKQLLVNQTRKTMCKFQKIKEVFRNSKTLFLPCGSHK